MNKQLEEYQDCDYKTIQILGYESSNGTVSDVLIDVDTPYKQAKEDDYEILMEYKDIEEVESLKEASEGYKDDYDTLWVKSYDALVKGFQPKPMTLPKAPTQSLCRGCNMDIESSKCYIGGFVLKTNIVKEGTTKKPRKKQVLTLFKDHMREKFLSTKYKVYTPKSGRVSLEGETLIIDCNED